MKKKLLQVCLSDGYGGMEIFFEKSARFLEENFAVHLMVKRGSELSSAYEDTHFDVTRLRFVNYVDLPAMWKIRRTVKTKDIDVVYFFGSTELGLIVPALLGLEVTLINRKGILVSTPKYDPYHRCIYRGVDCVVGNNPVISDNIREIYPVDGDRVETLFNGFEVKRFRRSRGDPVLSEYYPKEDNLKFVTTISRLVPGKGLEKFVRMANHVLENREDVVFFLVGTGDEDFRQELMEMVEPEWNDRVIFTGFERNIPRVHAETDLFLCLSEHEALGNTVVEAMMAGTPSLAVGKGGPSYLLREYPEFLVEPGTVPEQLAKRVLRLLDQYRGRRIDYDVENYTRDHYVQSFTELCGRYDCREGA